MTTDIALSLAQDGLAMSAIYALLAVSMVLLFSVTRVLFVPQGDFLSYGAMTLAALGLGRVPGTTWIVLGLSLLVAVVDGVPAVRRRAWRRVRRVGLVWVLCPLILTACVLVLAPRQPPLPVQVALALLLVAPLGPISYRLVFQPIARASVLTLLFVSVALHFALIGAGLVMFGPEVANVAPFFDAVFELGSLTIPSQTLFVIAACVAVLAALSLFFRTLHGKALTAAAVNHLGAELVGISPEGAGRLSFLIATLVAALAGVLAAPITPIYYDTGFVVGLRGIVASIFGGMVSYPLAAVGAVLVGQIEIFSSFWDSAYKEVIVFTLILPVLVWRSLASSLIANDEQDEESAA